MLYKSTVSTDSRTPGRGGYIDILEESTRKKRLLELAVSCNRVILDKPSILASSLSYLNSSLLLLFVPHIPLPCIRPFHANRLHIKNQDRIYRHISESKPTNAKAKQHPSTTWSLHCTPLQLYSTCVTTGCRKPLHSYLRSISSHIPPNSYRAPSFKALPETII